MVAVKALDQIGKVLKKQGLSLEELTESGRDVRSDVIAERYGLNATHDE